MTRLQKLKLVREILDELIEAQEQRKHGEIQRYEQRKARGLCAATVTCTSPLVEGKTLCEKHLRKSAKAGLDRFNRRKYYASDSGSSSNV